MADISQRASLYGPSAGMSRYEQEQATESMRNLHQRLLQGDRRAFALVNSLADASAMTTPAGTMGQYGAAAILNMPGLTGMTGGSVIDMGAGIQQMIGSGGFNIMGNQAGGAGLNTIYGQGPITDQLTQAVFESIQSTFTNRSGLLNESASGLDRSDLGRTAAALGQRGMFAGMELAQFSQSFNEDTGQMEWNPELISQSTEKISSTMTSAAGLLGKLKDIFDEPVDQLLQRAEQMTGSVMKSQQDLARVESNISSVLTSARASGVDSASALASYGRLSAIGQTMGLGGMSGTFGQAVFSQGLLASQESRAFSSSMLESGIIIPSMTTEEAQGMLMTELSTMTQQDTHAIYAEYMMQNYLNDPNVDEGTKAQMRKYYDEHRAGLTSGTASGRQVSQAAVQKMMRQTGYSELSQMGSVDAIVERLGSRDANLVEIHQASRDSRIDEQMKHRLQTRRDAIGRRAGLDIEDASVRDRMTEAQDATIDMVTALTQDEEDSLRASIAEVAVDLTETTRDLDSSRYNQAESRKRGIIRGLAQQLGGDTERATSLVNQILEGGNVEESMTRAFRVENFDLMNARGGADSQRIRHRREATDKQYESAFSGTTNRRGLIENILSGVLETGTDGLSDRDLIEWATRGGQDTEDLEGVTYRGELSGENITSLLSDLMGSDFLDTLKKDLTDFGLADIEDSDELSRRLNEDKELQRRALLYAKEQAEQDGGAFSITGGNMYTMGASARDTHASDIQSEAFLASADILGIKKRHASKYKQGELTAKKFAKKIDFDDIIDLASKDIDDLEDDDLEKVNTARTFLRSSDAQSLIGTMEDEKKKTQLLDQISAVKKAGQRSYEEGGEEAKFVFNVDGPLPPISGLLSIVRGVV